MLAGRKKGDLLRCNPGGMVYVQPNLGPVIKAGDAPLRIIKDLTRGTLVVKLIRNRIDEYFLDRCVKALSSQERALFPGYNLTSQAISYTIAHIAGMRDKQNGGKGNQRCSFLQIASSQQNQIFVDLSGGFAPRRVYLGG